MSDLWTRAKKVIPGGVNSPVRALASVGADPVFIKTAKGATLTDVDGNDYVDYVGSWGPMILGHGEAKVIEAIQSAADIGVSFGAATESEVDFAEYLVSRLPGMDQVRLVNSGTEATMSALRLARGYTGKDKIIKFRGCYHGHGDSFLIEAGSGAVTHGNPSSAGVTEGTAKDTIIADFNNLESVKEIFDEIGSEIGAIFVEPVAGNMGVVTPKEGFLESLKDLCEKYGAVLVFDEVMTGFRLSPNGFLGLTAVQPDILTFGKIIGGGLPVGAYAARTEIMSQISPMGPVYQAGTLSGNPLAIAAGMATLKQLENETVYQVLELQAAKLESGLRECFEKSDIPFTINRIGSMMTLFFGEEPVTDFSGALKCDTASFGKFFRGMLEEGVYLPPSQFEAWFISYAHTDVEIEKTISAAKEVLIKW
jgi:glutamate-1-semialdehyde 2,1-aminomutase